MSGDFNYFLTIVLLSSCFIGATYSQRKVNRNAATGSEGKQVVDFDCPEEFGYYPHPTDCTQYYVCVFGGALLESCTGGLMYSHELQTCDWPRNVGCDAGGISSVQNSPDHTPTRSNSQRYSTHQSSQPISVGVTSRGQTRQLSHQVPVQQEEDYQYKKQKQHQQQLYSVVESDLPPVEEIESDRQQRVYRGQPSTIGQVQRDRDALRHTNAIPVQNVRNSKIGVISFGTQQQQQQQQHQQSHIEQPQYRNLTGDDELDTNETILTNNQTLIDLNRLKRQVRYSRIHSIGLGPTKSSRFTWTAGNVPKKTDHYANRPKASSHYARLVPLSSHQQPFRPSVPEKPYSSKFNAFDPQFNYNKLQQISSPFPIHTILPLIHQSSFENNRHAKDNSSAVSYFNINSIQTPSTTLNRPNIEESYTYYNTLSTTTHAPPQFIRYENTGPQQFEVIEPENENSAYVHLGRVKNYNNVHETSYSTTEKPTNYYYITHQQPISNPSISVETKYPVNSNDYKSTSPKSPRPSYDESSSSVEEENDTEENLKSSTEMNDDEEKQNEEEEAFHDDFTPPPYFYNNHNKYEDIINPFANPDFNFDKYLEDLSGGSYTSKKPVETQMMTTVNIQTPRPFKPTQHATQKVTKRPVKYDESHDINEYASNNIKTKTKINQTKDELRYSTPKYPSTTASVDVKLKTDKSRHNESKRVTNTRKQNSRHRPNYQSDKDKRLLDNHHRIEPSTLAPPEQYAPAPRPVSVTNAGHSGNTGRALYNTSAQNYDQNQYDPYYTLYDDDVELYRDVDYGHNYNTAPISEAPKQVYRGTPAPQQQQPVESATVASRAPTQYIQQDAVPYNVHPQQTLYKQQVSSIGADYSDVGYEVDANQYQSADRNPGRGDRNDLRFPEPTTKKAVKTTTTRTTTSTTTTTTTKRPTTVSNIRLENITENPVKNGTKHESIFITLTAKPRFSPTPFQTTSQTPPSSPQPTNNILHTTTQQNKDLTIKSSIEALTSSTPRPSRFISLTAGFSLLNDPKIQTPHKDPEHQNDPTIKPQSLLFTQHDHKAINDNIETTTFDDVITPHMRPIPFKITNLPTPETKSITLQLTSSALGAETITGTNRHSNIRTVTESPFKREIHSQSQLKNSIDVSKTSTYIHPTTYSVPKYFLEALFHKTTPQGFKLTSTTSTSTHKPFTTSSTTTTTKRPNIVKEYYNFDYYDDDYLDEENNTNNTIPLLPVYHYTTTPNKIRTKDVVISIPEKVQKNRYTVERKPTSTENNLRTNQIINREPLIEYQTPSIQLTKMEVPSALMSDFDNLTTNNDVTDIIDVTSTFTSTTLRTFTDLPVEITTPPSTTPIIIQTVKSKPIVSTTQSTTSYLTSPGRVSRINPAIKSITTFGGARGSSKCNGNSTISHIKCNEIQQRTSLRGRGSAHYTSAGEDVPVNRGTPPTRSRPTLKPSTSIVSKASEFIDIYKYPPTRPSSVYPTPQVDKSAAKCRKDVCLLPDCYCGGKDVPGDLPVESIPQLVLLTFDDSVNDLNKGLYSDLFEKGRVNPNGCPISATFYVSHEWTDYSQVQNLYATGHEIASHTVSHSFGEQFSQKKWNREVAGQREILAAYGGVHLEDVRGMRAPFLSVGGNKMFKMLYDSNFTYDSSMPVYENRPPSWPYTLDYKLFHDCMIPPCPTRSYPGVWEVPMVMWQDLNGGRCSMGDACSNPPASDGVFKMLMKNFDRHYSTNRAPFGLFYHAAWFTQPHHKEGFIQFLDAINAMKDVYLVTNWQAIQWVRDPTPINRLGNFQPFQCNYPTRPKKCNNPKVCNLWHKSGVRYMRTCQPCPDIYPWTGKTGIKSSRIDNDIED